MLFFIKDDSSVGFPGGSVVPTVYPPVDTGDTGSVPGSGRYPEGNGYPLQYSCRENPTKEAGGLQSMGLQRVRRDLKTEQEAAAHCKKV